MSEIHIEYDASELKDYTNIFPEDSISDQICKEILFLPFEEVKEKFLFGTILSKVNHYSKPYRIEFIDIKFIDNRNVNIYLKVKNTEGLGLPKIIPHKKSWFIIGTGPNSKSFDIEMVDNMEEYSHAYERLFSGEYDFAYFCTLDENLEIIDWHTFYDYFDPINKESVIEVRKTILKKYKNYMS